ncbi:MAG: penicillin-binding protein 2, partial [Thermomicrobiaceae bacterium]|nr:penicillin-binding protein 2 [Thermomicrobiaceae bacterium]
MRLFARSSALIAAVLVIAYGLWRTRSQAETLWLTVVAVATLLLAVVFWPRVARGEPLMERTVVRVAVVFLVGFLALSVQLVRIQIVDSAEILGRSEAGPNGQVVLNPRESIEASRLIRGRILASDGSVIADTVRRPDGSFDRVYPDPATAYLAGYYSPLMYGSSGLEESYNAYLRGEQGGNPVTEWLDGILHRERHGYDLTLSIDPDLQRRADELLGNRQGAVILMDAKTGAVLAMVSKPNFDPNQLYANVGPNSDEQTRRAQAYWKELQQSGNSPLVVRATQGRYVPGSIFKTVTASAAIET